MFRALVLDKDGDEVRAKVEALDESRLPDGDVTVAVEYSTLNYKDGLIIANKAPHRLIALGHDNNNLMRRKQRAQIVNCMLHDGLLPQLSRQQSPRRFVMPCREHDCCARPLRNPPRTWLYLR